MKALVYFSVCNCHGMSDISAGQSFAEDKDIRQDQIRGKAVSDTSESCGNFVEYKEHTVLVAKFARAFQKETPYILIPPAPCSRGSTINSSGGRGTVQKPVPGH